MFFCEECRVSNKWPKNLRGYPDSRGNCEVCTKERDCYDVPSSALPVNPAPTPKGITNPDGTRRRRVGHGIIRNDSKNPPLAPKVPEPLTRHRIKNACYGGNYKQKIEDFIYEPIWLGGDFDSHNRAGRLISIVLDTEAKPIRNMVECMEKHGYRLVNVLLPSDQDGGREFWWMKEK